MLFFENQVCWKCFASGHDTERLSEETRQSLLCGFYLTRVDWSQTTWSSTDWYLSFLRCDTKPAENIKTVWLIFSVTPTKKQAALCSSSYFIYNRSFINQFITVFVYVWTSFNYDTNILTVVQQPENVRVHFYSSLNLLQTLLLFLNPVALVLKVPSVWGSAV